jgi:phage-related protein
VATAAQLVAEVKVTGASEAKEQLKGVSGSVKETSSGFKDMLGGALSFAAGQAVFNAVGQAAGFLKDQIGSVFTESEQAQQSMAQTVDVLNSTHDASGMTAQAVADLAGNFSHLTLFSDDTTQAAENMLLTFTNIGKTVFPDATKTVLDMSQALGQDTKSSAIQLGKALNDPITGITALQRVGVTFTDSQKNLIKSMVDSGNTAGAQKVILQELQREFGGSAEAAGKTFPGMLQILSQSFDDIKQKIGDAVLPILQQLTGWVSTNVLPIFNKFSDWITNVGVPALTHLGSYITGTVVPAFQNAGTWMSNFTGTANGMSPVLAGLGAVIGVALVPVVWSLAAGVIAATWPFLAIAAAVAGAVAIFEHFYNTNAGFKSFIDGLVGGLKQIWAEVSTNFLPVMKQIGTWISTYVMPILQQLGSFIVSQFQPVWQQLVQLWNSQLLPLFKQLWGAIQQLTPLFQLLGLIIGGLVVATIGVLIGLISGLAKGIAYMVEGLANAFAGIARMFTGVTQVIGGIVQFISDLIHGNFSKLGSDLGQIWQGIINIFTGAWQAIAGIFQAAWGLISGIVGGFIQGVIGFFTKLFDELVGHSIIPDMWNSIVGFFTNMPARILGGIESFVGNLLNRFNALKMAGIVIFQNLVGEIGKALNGLGGLATGAWNGMTSAVRSGVNNVIGLINGFINGIDKLHISIPGGATVGFSIPDIPYLATGGIIGGAGLANVGERGPERVWLPQGAQVIPNSQSFGNGQQPIIVNAILQVDGRMMANGLMPHIASAVRQATGVKF